MDSVYSALSNQHRYLILECFYHSEGNPVPVSGHSHSSRPSFPKTTDLLSVSAVHFLLTFKNNPPKPKMTFSVVQDSLSSYLITLRRSLRERGGEGTGGEGSSFVSPLDTKLLLELQALILHSNQK